MGLESPVDSKAKITGNEDILITMKASDLKAVIKQIVAEEVKREVQNQLPKLLFEMLGTKNSTVINETPKPKPMVKEQSQRSAHSISQPKQTKQYVKNPILNQILNETTPGLPQTPYGGSVLADIEGGTFDKLNVSDEFASEMRGILNEEVEEHREEPSSNGPDLNKLFNKPFKAILDKSKKKSGGGFGSSAVSMQNW
jgi:hypothetical protein